MSRARLAATLLVARRVAIVLLFALVLVRPGVGERPAEAEATDLEVLVVVDRTRSMAAYDWDGEQPRIEGVQSDLDALVDELPGARFGLITFGRVVRTELPFTDDASAFRTAVDTVRLEGVFDGSGSLVDRPVDEMRAVLQDAESQYPERPRMVLFVSDGENTAEGEQRSFADLAPYVDGGAVLGYGTADGGPMPLDDDLRPGEGFIVDDETGEDAISRLDAENLQTVAGQLGVDYVQRDAPGGVEALADGVEAEQVSVDSDAPAKYEVTWVVALLLLGLVLLELRRAWRGMLSTRGATP